jgi:hypothetical protein
MLWAMGSGQRKFVMFGSFSQARGRAALSHACPQGLSVSPSNPSTCLSSRRLHANRLVQTVTLHAILSYIISQPRVTTTSSHTIPCRSCQHTQQLISLPSAQLNIACQSKLNIINTAAAPGRMYPPLSPKAGAQPSSP